MQLVDHTVGDTVQYGGCFTHEEWIINKTPLQIAWELGLPSYRVSLGVYVIWASILPFFNDFNLGGYAKYATDKVSDTKFRWKGRKHTALYGITDFTTYKKQWLEEMKQRKLVKVVTVFPHNEIDDNSGYPSGNKAPQIIMRHKIECLVIAKLEDTDVFRGVFKGN